MDIEDRIESAIERITWGLAPMRVPADGTDPDMVLTDCLAEIRQLRALLTQRPEDCTTATLGANTDSRDAARYRWLRENCVETADAYAISGQLYFGTFAFPLDVALDDAMMCSNPEVPNVND